MPQAAKKMEKSAHSVTHRGFAKQSSTRCLFRKFTASLRSPSELVFQEPELVKDLRNGHLVQNQATFLGMTRCASRSQP
jgi:hypothetical protein